MKLKEIASINAGYPFRGRILEVAETNLVVVQMKDVSLNEGIMWPKCIPTLLTGKRKPDYLIPGDILLVARGSHNYAVQVEQSLLATGSQAVAAPHFFVLKLQQQHILPEFVVWLLNQAVCQRHFDQNAEGTLTKSIRRSVLENTPVVLPPLAKQRAIVAMARTLRQEQRLAQQLVQNGERMMRAVAKDLHKGVSV